VSTAGTAPRPAGGPAELAEQVAVPPVEAVEDAHDHEERSVLGTKRGEAVQGRRWS